MVIFEFAPKSYEVGFLHFAAAPPPAQWFTRILAARLKT